METKNVPLSSIILDYTLYPRHAVDAYTIARLADALEAGETLPPPIICAATKKVIDGFHRMTVYQRAYKDNPGHEIEVEARKYKDDAARFSDALALNARHGTKLTAFDLAHCIVLGRAFGLSDEDVRSKAAISERRFKELVENKLASVAGKPVALKNTLRNFADRNLSAGMQGVNDRAGGMNQRFYVNQVIDLVKHRAIDETNEPLLEALKELASELKAYFAEAKRKAI